MSLIIIFSHDIKVISKDKEALPNVHLVISLFRRWILGTHQGAISREHLEYYLDEYIFRFNRRKSKNRGLLFRRLFENAVQAEPVAYIKISKHSKPFQGINKKKRSP
jgi:hypothetical protein